MYNPGDTILDKYKIQEQIGKSYRSHVFKVEDISTSSAKAESNVVKIITIPPTYARINAPLNSISPEELDNFYYVHAKDINNEIDCVKMLDMHENITTYKDVQVMQHTGRGVWDFFILMDNLSPLSNIGLACESQLEIIKIGVDICKALEACHINKIVHRDISPGNIFKTEIGPYQLGNFTLAKRIGDAQSVGEKLGALTYMAPEVSKGEPHGFSADMYSLGIILFQLLNDGNIPFFDDTDNIQEAVNKRIAGEKLPMPKNAVDTLAEIILRACNYDPRDRYTTPTAMRKAFEALIQPIVEDMEAEYTPPPIPISESQKKKPKKELLRHYIAIGIAVGAVASIIFFIIWRHERLDLQHTSSDQTVYSQGNLVDANIVNTDTSGALPAEYNDTTVRYLLSVEVPAVVDEIWHVATAALQAEGFSIRSYWGYSDDIAEGRVIYQYPSAGTLHYSSTTVTITISRGVELVYSEVPEGFINPFFIGMWHVVGSSCEEISSLLDEDGRIEEIFLENGTGERLFFNSFGQLVRMEYFRWLADDDLNITYIDFYDESIRHTRKFLTGSDREFTLEMEDGSFIEFYNWGLSPFFGTWILYETTSPDIISKLQSGELLAVQITLYNQSIGRRIKTTVNQTYRTGFFWWTENGYLNKTQLGEDEYERFSQYQHIHSHGTLTFKRNGNIYVYHRRIYPQDYVPMSSYRFPGQTVPNAVNHHWIFATTMIELEGFNTMQQYQFSNTVEEGIVISQVPEAGNLPFINNNVTLVISLGPKPTREASYIDTSNVQQMSQIYHDWLTLTNVIISEAGWNHSGGRDFYFAFHTNELLFYMGDFNNNGVLDLAITLEGDYGSEGVIIYTYNDGTVERVFSEGMWYSAGVEIMRLVKYDGEYVIKTYRDNSTRFFTFLGFDESWERNVVFSGISFPVYPDRDSDIDVFYSVTPVIFFSFGDFNLE